MNTTNSDGDLVLTRKPTQVPRPAIVEHHIRAALELEYNAVYVETALRTMTVDSCDENHLIIHAESDFECTLIHERVLPVAEALIAELYGIRPVISVVRAY